MGVIRWDSFADELTDDAIDIVFGKNFVNGPGPWRGTIKYVSTGYPQAELRAFKSLIAVSTRGYKVKRYDTRQSKERLSVIDLPREKWPTVHFGLFACTQLTLVELRGLISALEEAIDVIERLEPLIGTDVLVFSEEEC